MDKSINAVYGTVGDGALEASVEESDEAVKNAYEHGMDADSFAQMGGKQ